MLGFSGVKKPLSIYKYYITARRLGLTAAAHACKKKPVRGEGSPWYLPLTGIEKDTLTWRSDRVRGTGFK